MNVSVSFVRTCSKLNISAYNGSYRVGSNAPWKTWKGIFVSLLHPLYDKKFKCFLHPRKAHTHPHSLNKYDEE